MARTSTVFRIANGLLPTVGISDTGGCGVEQLPAGLRPRGRLKSRVDIRRAARLRAFTPATREASACAAGSAG